MAAKKNNIKKIELNFLIFLKELTNFLNRDTYDIKHILKLIEKHDVSPQFLFNRLIAYAYTYPYLMWYINKYMNNKYEFYKYDVESFLISFKYLMKTNKYNKLFFFKSKDFKDENKFKIKKLLKEYYSTMFNKQMNDLELNHLYLMFVKKIISIDDIQKINTLLNGEQSKFVISEDNLINSNNNVDNSSTVNKAKLDEYINYQISKLLPDNIYNFTVDLLNKKKQNCEKCPLFNKTMISLDTNVSDFQPVDLMFILLNPGNDEVTYKKLCVGKTGRIFRESMYELNTKTSWVITNIIQCSTSTQKDIGKTEKAIKKIANDCKTLFLDEIIKKFPAKYYVLVGKHAMESFGVKGSITQNSGSIQTVDNNIIIPMIHPSSLEKNINNKPIYDKTWQVIYQVTNKLKNANNQVDNNIQVNSLIETSNKQTNANLTNKFNVDDSKILTSDIIPNNLTYFDSVNLDNSEMLNIYIDNNTFEKFYQIVKFNVPIFIKKVNNYTECDMMNQNFEYITHVNGWNKHQLSKALKDNLIRHKYAALNQKG